MREPWITDTPSSPRFPHYTRANAGEVMPDPVTPLGWTFVWEEAFLPGFCDGNEATGAFAPGELDRGRPQDVGGNFGGYYYINLSSMRIHGIRNPGVTLEQLEAGLLGTHPDVPAYVPHPDDDRPDLVPAIVEHTTWMLTTTQWPELDEDRLLVDELRAGRPDLSAVSSASLLARARAAQPLLRRTFARHAVSSFGAATGPAILAAIGAAVGRPELPTTLLAGLGDVESAEPVHALWELSRIVRRSPGLAALFDEEPAKALLETDFAARWAAYLDRYGYRGPNEWELMAHSYETDPALGLIALDRIRHQPDDAAPAQRSAQLSEARDATMAAVRAELADRPELAAQFDAALGAGRFIPWRERTKSNAVRAMNEVRLVFHELSRRADLEDPRDLYMLRSAELDGYLADPSALRTELADRRADWQQRFDLEPPFIVADGAVPPIGTWRRRSRTGGGTGSGTLQGISGSPGVATGRARVVLDPFDVDGLEPGDVLVASNTDPSWTPLFLVAGAVVVDSGSQVSHSVIVSRELGLPCVIAVTGASTTIPDGAQVTVDGSAGTVRIH